MDYNIIINTSLRTSKKDQLVNAIINGIDKGLLKRNEKLPSINTFARTLKIARETVEKAYKILIGKGYVVSIPSRGNFVSTSNPKKLRVLLLLNKMSAYKKEVYDAFVTRLENFAKVDLKIYHYDPDLLRSILIEDEAQYHYIAVMPHFFYNTPAEIYVEVLQLINPEKLVLLDKDIDLQGKYISVFQDFELDIFEKLKSSDIISDKYKNLTVIFPRLSHHPKEILDGIEAFCMQSGLTMSIVESCSELIFTPETVVITLAEKDLGELMKMLKSKSMIAGKDLGILSFNDTIFKELLEVSVISTDFERMGRLAAQMILDKDVRRVRNSFKLVARGSL